MRAVRRVCRVADVVGDGKIGLVMTPISDRARSVLLFFYGSEGFKVCRLSTETKTITFVSYLRICTSAQEFEHDSMVTSTVTMIIVPIANITPDELRPLIVVCEHGGELT